MKDVKQQVNNSLFSLRKRARTLVAVIVLMTLVACGGGGGNDKSAVIDNAVSSATITPIQGGIIKSASGDKVLVSIEPGVVVENMTAIVTTSSNHSDSENDGKLVSQVVTLQVDVNKISTTNGNVTINIPLQSPQAGLSWSDIAGTLSVIKIRLGDGVNVAYKYAKVSANNTTNKAEVPVTFGADYIKAYGGRIEAAVFQIIKNGIGVPDGKLFKLNADDTDSNVSSGRVALPVGKIPLVLVHGIQPLCLSAPTAYKDTWHSFSSFFYNDSRSATLREKFDLYSFEYRTDEGIAGNGEKLKSQLETVFGTTKVVVLAHSMGGLVSRYADINSADGLLGLVTLDTPHHGTTDGIVDSGIVAYYGSKYFATTLSSLESPISMIYHGLYTGCSSALHVQGAQDLRYDYFDSPDASVRCTNASQNSFLCSDDKGLNRKPLRAPMFIYSGLIEDNAGTIELISEVLLANNSMRVSVLSDGDVPLFSQMYLRYTDVVSDTVASSGAVIGTGALFSTTKSRYLLQDGDLIKTASTYNKTSHVQIHDNINVFTSAGDMKLASNQFGNGLISDLLSLIPKVTVIAPEVVTLGSPTTFTVTGQNLPLTAVMSLAEGTCQTPSSRTATGFTVVCTPGSTAGNKAVTISATSGGTVIDASRAITISTVPVPPPPSSTGLLPDTGITSAQCYQVGGYPLVSCTSTGAIALNDKQDGMVGRDVTTPNAVDGKLGFSYSTVGSYPITDCVKDNITGLTWEGKPTTGARISNAIYTNYGDNRAGDASAYVAAVNTAGLCGYTDWRLPTADELQTLVDYGVAGAPDATIDSTWFPNTPPYNYWTATKYAGDSSHVWVVYFGLGYVSYGGGRDNGCAVRLVR